MLAVEHPERHIEARAFLRKSELITFEVETNLVRLFDPD
jgi:hypothetical protein